MRFANRRIRRLIAVSTLSLLSGASGATAAVHRLSDGQSFSNVEFGYSKPTLTPDGQRIVYCQDAVLDGAFELWSVRVAGGAPVRLSAPLAAGRLACWFRISPNGARVVYLANQDTASTYELWSAPIDGALAAIQLNPALVANGNVTTLFEISPDSSTVVYRADQLADERFEIFSVPIAGGSAVQINAELFGPLDVTSFAISPTGLHVVYLSDQSGDEIFALHGAPIGGGGTWWNVIPGNIAVGDVLEYELTGDGAYVVARGDRDFDEVYQLYRGTTASYTGVIQIGGALAAGGDVLGFSITSDDERVVFLADLEVDNRIELYSVTTAGGPVYAMSGDPVLGGDVDSGWTTSADGQRVVYVADELVDGRYELFANATSGGDRIQLSPAIPGASYVALDPLVAPNSASVLYRVVHGSGLGTTELYSVPILGGTSLLLSPVPATGISTAQRQVVAGGGAHLFFELQSFPDPPGTNTTTLYRAALAGGELIQVGPALDLAAGETFGWIGAAADPRQALFVANPQTGFESELYLGDSCVFCDAFESSGFDRWSGATP